MTPACGDLKGPLCLRLPLDVGKIKTVFARVHIPGPAMGSKTLQGHLPFEKMDDVEYMAGAVNLYALYDRRFVSVLHGDDYLPVPFLVRKHCDRQNTADALDPSVERQLTGNEITSDLLFFHDPHCSEDADGDRQVKRGAFLSDIRRGKVYRNTITGELKAAVFYSSPDPFLALPDRGLRQTHNVERRQPVGYVNLHVDLDAVYTI
ncbi:MAG: hypothetical protein A4E64_00407 [Syntrophorhabdus sp. PtaU1.Bin058]|nr:MAG: hypothetical protein A4E64_00407 [Syntrophorhabdus sp. PtaU1.Bin058]